MVSNIDEQRFLQIFKGKSNTYVKNNLPKEKPEKGVKTKTKITQVEGLWCRYLPYKYRR